MAANKLSGDNGNSKRANNKGKGIGNNEFYDSTS